MNSSAKLAAFRFRHLWFLVFLFVVFLLAGLHGVCPAGNGPNSMKPNVLLILVDDLKPALGCYGDSMAKAPNLDRLAARGMRFDAAYCNQAVCAPSRFTLMLGSHSTSTGLYGLGSRLRDLLPDAVTLPQYFAKHGYRTESLGKVFHIGHGNLGDPQSFSVPHFHDKVIEYADPNSIGGGLLTREEAYFTNRRLGEIRSLPRGAAFESPAVADDTYADGRVAAETVRRLRAAKERRATDGTPFFIAVGFARPHLPFSAPKKYWDLHDAASLPLPRHEELPVGAPAVAGKRGGEIANYEPVPTDPDAKFPASLKRSLIHGYYASVSYVDAQIGKVVDAVDALELAKDTIIVVWGDHGFHLGDLGIWTKHTNYEQANRIPMIIVAPGVTKPQQVTRQLAESVDIYPTLCELAGLPEPQVPQPIDGVSLVPVLAEPNSRVRDHAYHVYPKRLLGRAIRTDRYRMVQWKQPGADEETAEYELYDYANDTEETENLAAKRLEVLAELKQILSRYPEATSRVAPKSSSATSSTPQIANRAIVVTATVKSDAPHGVVVAQGGREYGYALHFLEGRPAFDVRIGTEVKRVQVDATFTGTIRLRASLDAETMKLAVDDRPPVSVPSPGLIPRQPKDSLSIGHDSLTAAGDYEAPNPFRGEVIAQAVSGRPLRVAKLEAVNVIVVFIDDMGFTDLSCFGGKATTTEHIDRLASEGIRFTNFYVNSPICSPSRTALTTGQYPQRWRITSYLSNRQSNKNRGLAQWLDPKAPVLARELRSRGYFTGHFGKWHMGGQRDVGDAPLINQYGFDHSLTNFEGLGPRVLGYMNAFKGGKPRLHHLGSNDLGKGPIEYADRSVVTARFVERAIEHIDQAAAKEQPFFINLWPDDVHSPFFPPEELRQSTDESKRQLYYAVLDAMDQQLAPLFNRVRNDRKLRERTLILLCSDNGHEPGAGHSSPLRGSKALLYEGGIRSPLIVWGPGLLADNAAGTVNETSVFSAIDVNRSLYALTGTPVPDGVTLDGKNVIDTILGKTTAGRQAPIFFRRPPDRPGGAVGGNRDAASEADAPDLAVRDGRWKFLVNYDGSNPQLFDLAADVSESENVIGEHPEVAERLRKAVFEWNAEMPADAGDPNFRSPATSSGTRR